MEFAKRCAYWADTGNCLHSHKSQTLCDNFCSFRFEPAHFQFHIDTVRNRAHCYLYSLQLGNSISNWKLKSIENIDAGVLLLLRIRLMTHLDAPHFCAGMFASILESGMHDWSTFGFSSVLTNITCTNDSWCTIRCRCRWCNLAQ